MCSIAIAPVSVGDIPRLPTMSAVSESPTVTAVGVVISTNGQLSLEEVTTTTEEVIARAEEIEVLGRKSPTCTPIGLTCGASSIASSIAGSGRRRSARPTAGRPICSCASAIGGVSFSSGAPMGRRNGVCPTMASRHARPPCRRLVPCTCP